MIVVADVAVERLEPLDRLDILELGDAFFEFSACHN